LLLRPGVARDRLTGFGSLVARPGEERPVLPPALAPALEAAPLFAIMDAARVPNLVALLESSGLPHQCLFADALGDSSEAAPWLVRLEPDHDLTRAIFTIADPPGPSHLWPTAPLLLQAEIGLDALRKHLRRFLRVQSEDRSKLWLFRFWEPTVVPYYFSAIADRPELMARWFRPREGGRILRLFIADTRPGDPALWSLEPFGLRDEPANPQGAFALSSSDHAAMHLARTEHDLGLLAALLVKTFPAETADLPPAEVDRLTRRTVSRMQEFGFTQRDYLFQLLAWEAFLGPIFETRDPDLARLIRSPAPEAEKFAAVADRMSKLG
jgi:hypothetical protein